jgi:hypothetical protein
VKEKMMKTQMFVARGNKVFGLYAFRTPQVGRVVETWQLVVFGFVIPLM